MPEPPNDTMCSGHCCDEKRDRVLSESQTASPRVQGTCLTSRKGDGKLPDVGASLLPRVRADDCFTNDPDSTYRFTSANTYQVGCAPVGDLDKLAVFQQKHAAHTCEFWLKPTARSCGLHGSLFALWAAPSIGSGVVRLRLRSIHLLGGSI